MKKESVREKFKPCILTHLHTLGLSGPECLIVSFEKLTKLLNVAPAIPSWRSNKHILWRILRACSTQSAYQMVVWNILHPHLSNVVEGSVWQVLQSDINTHLTQRLASCAEVRKYSRFETLFQALVRYSSHHHFCHFSSGQMSLTRCMPSRKECVHSSPNFERLIASRPSPWQQDFHPCVWVSVDVQNSCLKVWRDFYDCCLLFPGWNQTMEAAVMWHAL